VRNNLAASRSTESAARATLHGLQTATAADVADRNRADTLAAQRRHERDVAQRQLTKLEQDLASTDHQRSGVLVVLEQLARYSSQRDACIEGVQHATAALRRGSTHDAVEALAHADAPCSAALAAVTGARYPYDFPDPSVLRVGSRYYAYSTNAGAGNIQVLESRDLVPWTLEGDALAAVAAWASPGATWAPSVVAIGGHFVAYYTVRDRGSGLECVSVAIAAQPVGPFVDFSKAPLVCQSGGSIDPSPFVDANGAITLLWKSEAIPLAPTIIWSQPLTPDGLALTGTPAQLLVPGSKWEHGIVEAPSMLRIGGHDYLFYSGNVWATAAYAEGVALCDGPAGPCRRVENGPVLASQSRLAGPGGAAAFTTPDGKVQLAFAAFTQPDVGYPNSRTLHFASVQLVAGTPVVVPE
jgi:beta-xylosidase